MMDQMGSKLGGQVASIVVASSLGFLATCIKLRLCLIIGYWKCDNRLSTSFLHFFFVFILRQLVVPFLHNRLLSEFSSFHHSLILELHRIFVIIFDLIRLMIHDKFSIKNAQKSLVFAQNIQVFKIDNKNMQFTFLYVFRITLLLFVITLLNYIA